MTHYTLMLINKDPNLSLIQKRRQIKKVFDHIRNGGESGHSFKDLRHYQNLNVRKDCIEVDVQESGTSWHPWVGRVLANEYAMRQYCHGMSLNHMFKWN